MTDAEKDVHQDEVDATRTETNAIDDASALRIRLSHLHASIEDLKQAPAFLKAGKAEATLDSALRMIRELVTQVEQLQEVQHGQR